MTLLTGALFLNSAGPTNRNIRVEMGAGSGSYTLSEALAKKQSVGNSFMSDFEDYTHYLKPNIPSSLSAQYFISADRMQLDWNTASFSAGPPTNEPLKIRFDRQKNSEAVVQGILIDGFPPLVETYNDLFSCDDQNYRYKVFHQNGYGDGGRTSYTPYETAGCSCLLGDADIMIGPDLYKNIKDLNIGDEIYTTHQFDPRTFGYYTIVEITEAPAYLYYELKFGEERIRCSRTHKMMCEDGDICMNTIEVGDKVLRLKDNEITEVTLTSKLLIESKEVVYNIEVGDAHTYISKNGIIHHNKLP